MPLDEFFAHPEWVAVALVTFSFVWMVLAVAADISAHVRQGRRAGNSPSGRGATADPATQPQPNNQRNHK